MAIYNKRVLFIATGIITIAVFAGVLALLLNINAFAPRIEAAVATALGMDVRIEGKIGIALIPGFGLSMENVTVRNKGLDVAKIEKVKIGLKLIPSAWFRIEIHQVELIKPVFTIARSTDGMFGLERPARTSGEEIRAVNTISIAQGSLVYIDETAGETIEAGDLDLSIKNLFVSRTNSAEPFRAISFYGDIRCKTFKIYGLTLMNLVMSVAGDKGLFDINLVDMNIAGGTGIGSIHVDMTEPSPQYKLICKLNRVRIEELLDLYALNKIPRKTIEGPIDFSADLTAVGKSADAAKRSLAGNLSLSGQDLMLYNIDIDALIMKYQRSQNLNLVDVGAFLLAGPFGPVLTKSYNFTSLYEASQGGKGIVKKIVSDWAVKNGIAQARDVALASKRQRIAMQGGLNFISERFVDITIAALDKQGCAVYSEKVRGPFRKPQIEKENIFESLVGSVMNPLKDGWKFLQGEACTVFYAGSVLHPQE
jgi:uncharacterized protein involved in outer membrane biogenesis